MTNNKVLLAFPLHVTFRNATIPPAANLWIRSEAANLGKFYHRIMGCRVELGSPHRHHKKGSPYHVRVDLTVPGGELVIKHEPSLATRARQSGERTIKKHLAGRSEHKYLRQAINDAFKAAGRVLEDYVRRQRGDVKHREAPPVGKVSQLFPDKDYGFLATADGRDIYFHKDSVLNHAFGRLKIGTKVSFAEEQGDKGPQASTVRILGKQGVQPAIRQRAA